MSRAGFLGGFCVAVVLVLGIAEGHLRLFPSVRDQAYRGDASSLTGPFVDDPVFGLAYGSKASFERQYPGALGGWLGDHVPDRRPAWAFFGNSFVQAAGMLADHAREALPERRILNLGRNEPLVARFAQIRLLLEEGFRPERLFFVLLPLDVVDVARQPLDTIDVTRGGALAYRPRLPRGPAGWLVRRSALAREAWFRAGRHRGNPTFRAESLNHRVDPRLLADLRRLFGGLHAKAAANRVASTVVLVPNHEQIIGEAPYALQDALVDLFREIGLDVVDARDAFDPRLDRKSLFLPDKHFSAVGNRLLLQRLLDHTRRRNATAGAGEVAAR